MVGADAACGREQLAGWADVDVALIVECKVGTRESAILTGALIPDWNVRRDTGLDQPTQELAGAVGRVGDETLEVCRKVWGVTRFSIPTFLNITSKPLLTDAIGAP